MVDKVLQILQLFCMRELLTMTEVDFRFLIDPRVQVHSTPTKPEFFRMKLQVCDNPTLLFDETPGYVPCFDETLSF